MSQDTFRSIGDLAAEVVADLKPMPLGPVDRVPIQSREQWLGLRRTDITASDVASICGVGRRSALAVWAEKTGRIASGTENAVMRRGRWFEPAIFEALAEERPSWEIRRAKIYLRASAHRLGATPDAVAIDPERDGIVVVQGKVVSRPVFRNEWLDDPDDDYGKITPPIGYQLQTLTEAMLAEAAYGQHAHAVLAALVLDTFTVDLHVIDLPRHVGAEAKILKRTKAFWDDADAGRQPPVDDERDHETIKTLFPADNGEEIDLSYDNELPGIVDELQHAKDTIKSAEIAKQMLDTQIRGKMAEAAFARMADGRRISLKLQHRGSYTVKPTEFRVLRVLKAR